MTDFHFFQNRIEGQSSQKPIHASDSEKDSLIVGFDLFLEEESFEDDGYDSLNAIEFGLNYSSKASQEASFVLQSPDCMLSSFVNEIDTSDYKVVICYDSTES